MSGWPTSRFCVRLRPDFSCNLCAFSANKPDRLLSIRVQFVHFRVKAVFFAGHFVIASFVFMHIAGSIFIFNISKGPGVISKDKLAISRTRRKIDFPPPCMSQRGTQRCTTLVQNTVRRMTHDLRLRRLLCGKAKPFRIAGGEAPTNGENGF